MREVLNGIYSDPSIIVLIIMILLIIILFLVILSHRKTHHKIDTIHDGIHDNEWDSLIKKTHDMVEIIYQKTDSIHSK